MKKHGKPFALLSVFLIIGALITIDPSAEHTTPATAQTPPASAEHPIPHFQGEDWWIDSLKDWNADGAVDGPTIINPIVESNGRSQPEGEDNYGVPGVVIPITQKEADKTGITDANHIQTISFPTLSREGRTLRRISRNSIYPYTKKYRRRPRPSLKTTEWSKALNLTDTMILIKKKLSTDGWHGPYRIKQAHTNNAWTKEMFLAATLKASHARLKQWEPGKTLCIKSKHGFILAVRIVKHTYIINLANTTDAIDKVYTALKWNFNEWNFLGTFVCKRIAGSASWSQHAYGNAIDFSASSSQMHAMAYWLVDKAIKGLIPVSQVIYARQVWTPMYGWQYYSGIDGHYTHVHVSGAPYLYGTPSCAY